MFFFVDLPSSSAILKSGFLVLLPYSSGGKSDGVVFRMARMSVAELLI